MAILATEKVPTLDYWKAAYQLKTGDYVFDRLGNIVQVKLVQEYRASHCYRITFDDGLSISGDQNLLLPIESISYRNSALKYKWVQRFRQKLTPTKPENLHGTPVVESVPTIEPLKFPHQELPVPPFIFGFWFFNRKKNKRMTPPKGLKEDVHSEFHNAGYKIRERWLSESGEREFEVTPSIESHLGFIIPHKIPNNYLLASPEQRFELLRGIIYSKPAQYNQKTREFRFSSKKYSDIQQIQFIAESLGFKTRPFYQESIKGYRVTFRSTRKLISTQVPKHRGLHESRRFIRTIEKIEPQGCIHIETTAPDNTLVVGEGFITVC